MEKGVYCNVKIKQEQLAWNWNQQNPAVRKQKQDEIQKLFIKNFYSLINIVVALGGTVCLDKGSLDNEWRMHNATLIIRIGKNDVDQIRSLPFIDDLSVDYRNY